MTTNHKRSALPISVIIPVFNSARTLPDLIQALSVQSFPKSDFEVIFVDNGSTDNSVEIIKHISKNQLPLAIFTTEHNTPGSYAARNKGTKIANGNLFAFTDADCIPEKDWLLNAYSSAEKYGAGSIIGGRVNLVAMDPMKPNPVELFEIIFGFKQSENIKIKGYSVTANLVVSKQDFFKVGKFNPQLKSKGDFEWCTRAKNCKLNIYYDDDIVINHPARNTLHSLITKTRRVTGGQKDIKSIKTSHSNKPAPALIVRLIKVTKHVLEHESCPKLHQKLLVVGVGILVILAKYTEIVRLSIGYASERR